MANNEKKPKISIIVPVFNVENYIKRCLDSIANQSFSDFEVILVDDGSTDKSGIICDNYATKDSRFRVVHQNNGGVSVARNTGLDIAQGQYYSFIDSDDWIEKTMYEDMLSISIKNNADIVVCDYRQENGNDYTEVLCEKEMSQEELFLDVFGTPSLLIGACWNKLFSKSCVKDLRFNAELTNYEDTLFLCECYMRCKKAIYLKKKYYVTTVRNDSLSRKKDVLTINNKCDGCLYLYNAFIKRNVSKRIKRQITYKTLDSLLKYARETKLLEKNNDSNELLVRIKRKMYTISVISVIAGYISLRRVHGFFDSLKDL